MKRLRIAIGGVHIESSTSSPHRSAAGDFDIRRGPELLADTTSRRKPYQVISDFTDLGVEPREMDLTVVKVGYLAPEFFAAATGWVIASRARLVRVGTAGGSTANYAQG